MAKKFAEHSGLNLTQVNNDILEMWREKNVFWRSVDEREGCPQFVFFEGPPSANGHPGIHHVLARTIKDTFNRYKTMKGYQVKRKAGWDTHGLPVELGIEGLEEGIDVFHGGVGWCVAPTAKYKVRVGTHLVKKVEGGFAHLLRCTILKERYGVEITHGESCGWYVTDDILHAALVAKMVSSSTSSHHRWGAVSLVAAVVENDDEVVVLHAVDDAFHVL